MLKGLLKTKAKTKTHEDVMLAMYLIEYNIGRPLYPRDKCQGLPNFWDFTFAYRRSARRKKGLNPYSGKVV